MVARMIGGGAQDYGGLTEMFSDVMLFVICVYYISVKLMSGLSYVGCG